MPRPIRVAQITDSHLGADWQRRDPLDTLHLVLDAIAALPQPPDAIVHTGDLTNDGSHDEYLAFRAAVAQLDRPLTVIPGNHDDRAAMRTTLELAGDDGEPIQEVLDLGGLRVVALDSTMPGEPGGRLDAGRLEWLDERLGDEPDVPTIIALHHPPFTTGLTGMDGIALDHESREALGQLIAAYPRVVGTIAGHVHRAITASLGGRPAVTIPGTYAQAPLDFAAESLPMLAEPLAFGLHTVIDGRLLSHTQPLAFTAD